MIACKRLMRCVGWMCSVVIKVGMLGDSQIGKTSLMVKYVEGHFDEDYIQTLGESARPFHTLGLAYSPSPASYACQASILWKRPSQYEEHR